MSEEGRTERAVVKQYLRALVQQPGFQHRAHLRRRFVKCLRWFHAKVKFYHQIAAFARWHYVKNPHSKEHFLESSQ